MDLQPIGLRRLMLVLSSYLTQGKPCQLLFYSHTNDDLKAHSTSIYFVRLATLSMAGTTKLYVR